MKDKIQKEMKDRNKAITKRVLRLIQDRNTSKYRFAKLMDIPMSSVYALLAGKLYWSIENLVRVTHVLNTDLQYLIFGVGNSDELKRQREKILKLSRRLEVLEKEHVFLNNLKNMLKGKK